MTAICVLLGLIAWTLIEYLMHRFVFHQRLLGAGGARDNLRHHARVDWFAPAVYRVALALALTGVLMLAGLAFREVRPFGAITLGLIAGWLFYEGLHRRIHVAAPIGGYGRWARRHHLSHHFADAQRNHGVTSPLWDFVFGTYLPAPVVRVPGMHAGKFPWLIEAGPGRSQGVRAGWAREYVIGGSANG